MTLRHDAEDIVEGNGVGPQTLVERVMDLLHAAFDQEDIDAAWDAGHEVGKEAGYESGYSEAKALYAPKKETKQ